MTSKKFSRGLDRMHQGVIEAKEWAEWLVRRELRGPGGLPGAMKRVERRHNLPPGVLRSLRYRNPDDILHSVYVSIRDAYLAEHERQQRALNHEANLVKASIRAASDIIGSRDS